MNRLKIDKRNVEEMLGLTSTQEGMLFHYLSNRESLQYFEQFRLKMRGKIEVPLFEEAWKITSQVNETLRTVIRWEKLEEPVQLVLKDKIIPLRIEDGTHLDADTQHQWLETITMEDRRIPIDLTSDPLRITLCLLDISEIEMILSFHHILFDGWSTTILLTEFIDNYNRLLQGEKPGTLQKTRYKEYYKWFRRQLADHEERDAYWKQYMDGFDTHTQLPYNQNKVKAIESVNTSGIDISPSLSGQIRACSQECNVTLSCILYTAWGILLQKYNNSNDIIFGTAVSGRPSAVKGIEQMAGLFINTLPLRFKTENHHSIRSIIQALHDHLNERSRFDHTPLTDIVKFSPAGKESDLFDSLFVIDNYPLALAPFPDIDITPEEKLTVVSYDLFEMTSYDLTVQVLPMTHERLDTRFHFNADVFDTATIRRMARHYVKILEEIAGDSSIKLEQIEMITREEKQQILNQFNNPDIAFAVDKTIHNEIQQQVDKDPDKIAVVGGPEFLTYSELDRTANRLARVMAEYGVTPQSRVALMFPRSVAMIVGLLAILKAGAACIPLEISYPAERNGFIIEDSEAHFLLKDTSVDFKGGAHVVDIEYDLSTINTYPSDRLNIDVQPRDLSYIIYTSGSTGKPKGALLHHSGIVNHTYTKIDVFGITADDIVANNFSINVIAAVWQILSPLFAGAKMVVYSDEVEWDPYLQFQRVEIDGVTVIELIPPVLKTYLFLLDEGKKAFSLPGLRKIGLTSEETKPILVNKFYSRYSHIKLVDCYGQTECCDDVLHYIIPYNTHTVKVPIGTPALNTNILILDHHGQMQPVGVPGEICVIGAGVCYGYWKREEMTSEKFKPHGALNKSFYGVQGRFLQKEPLGSLYRTGDLGRWMEDGKVEYLGRIDHQVKIRGNRVELREIENHVLVFPGLKEAAVVAREDNQGEKVLYAFFVSAQLLNVSDFRKFLLQVLPDYMVPAHFVQLDQIPLTPNGKIDRKLLVKMPIKTGNSISSGADFNPPRNAVENKIQVIWNRLLERDNIGMNDNFFDLGGHSLLLIKLKNKLEKEFDLDREIPIVELFNHPTIGLQGKLIEDRISGKSEAEVSVLHIDDRGESPDRGVAVIGMALRVPGAPGIDEFWSRLIGGEETISFFSQEELEVSLTGKMLEGHLPLVPAGGILGDIEVFDAGFFGYTPREAEIMDPQQRLFLEYSWMALEDAGYVGETYGGSIGVYAGVGWNIYLLNNILSNPGVIKSMGEFQTMIGNDKDFIATRVGYRLNLRGPAVTVQAACSTSLVAIHMAKQSILNGECDIALAGGVAVKVPEKTGYYYAEGGHMSPDGHCRPFDAEAKGTVFGNGIAVVVLKRLEDAVKDGDHIYAVLKGSALNNDGSLKVGYTSPSEAGQVDVVLRALKDARVSPDTIGFVETHGTGTVLGDPVEMSALTRAYRTAPGNTENRKQYCAVGSVKANVGHLDVAAGAVGFIKAVLCLYHGKIPPVINFTRPNPLIDFENSPFYVNVNVSPWQSQDSTPRRAAVSSLGIGGTNAHVILEEAPPDTDSSPRESRPFQLVLVSAQNPASLDRMTRQLGEYFEDNPSLNFADAAYTLQVGRSRFAYRRMAVCSSVKEAADVFSKGSEIPVSYVKEGNRPIVFMFPGQGSQYPSMCYELYPEEGIFREEMDRCFSILEEITGRNFEEIWKDEIRQIDQTQFAQPLIFAVEYSLAKLLMSWGITPYAMIGHSIGEYTAACLSGVMTLEDALRLVVARGRLMQSVPPGSMLSVPLPKKDLDPLLGTPAGEGLSIAAVNSPGLCVVSGPIESIERFETYLKENRVECSRLHTSHAFHSAMMDPILKEYCDVVRQVKLQKPSTLFISNFRGDWMCSDDAVTPEYWARHLRDTVCFSQGLARVLELESPILLEVGPGKTLYTFVKQQLQAGKKENRENTAVIDLVRHPQKQIPDLYYLLEGIGRLWFEGVEINWRAFYKSETRKRLSLPTYSFEKQKYWLEPGEGHVVPGAGTKKSAGTAVTDVFYIPVWKQSFFKKGDSQEFYTNAPTRSQNPEMKAVPIQTESDHTTNIAIYPGTANAPTRSVEEKGDSQKNEEEKKDETVGTSNSGTYIIFIDQTPPPVFLELIHRLKENQCDVITVTAGPAFHQRSEMEYTINPERVDDYTALFEKLGEHGKTVRRIILTWMESTLSTIDFLQRGVSSLLALAKAIGSGGMFDTLDLWVLTRGMQKIESTDSGHAMKASILGPCCVVSQEYPNIVCRSMDIDFTPPLNASINSIKPKTGVPLNLIISELMSPGSDRVVAYRGKNRWIPCFEPIKIEKPQDKQIDLRPNGVYLITGGMGFIGFTIAEYLAEKFNARLILTGRSISMEHTDKIKKLEEYGAEVLAVRADVANEEEMKRVRSIIEEKFGALHGIIHAAGVMDGHYFKGIPDLTPQDNDAHFIPKIHGLMVLERVFGHIVSDFVIVTSSLSSVLGGLGLFGYSAANSFMDMFVMQCNDKEEPRPRWIGIDWDEWDKPLPASCENTNRNRNKKQESIGAGEGKDIFERILGITNNHIDRWIISKGDFEKRFRDWVKIESKPVESREETSKPVGNSEGMGYSRSHLKSVFHPPENEAEKIAVEIWQELLGIKEIGVHDDFFELGGHSLLATRVVSRLREIFRIDIPLAVFFNKPTIRQVLEYLIAQWGDGEIVQEIARTYREAEETME